LAFQMVQRVPQTTCVVVLAESVMAPRSKVCSQPLSAVYAMSAVA